RTPKPPSPTHPLDPRRIHGPAHYFLTTCTDQRRPIFEHPTRAKAANRRIRTSSRHDEFPGPCFLRPDHVHILVEGAIADSDRVRFIARWKQTTGYVLRNELPKRFWQRRFYDHVLRKSADADSVAQYIWMNPVRRDS